MARKLEHPEDRWPQFPDPIRPLYEDLWQDVAALHRNWTTYLELFDEPEKITLLNATAPSCFGAIEDALRNDMTMSVGRLLDLATSLGKKDNLSLSRLLDELQSHCDKTFIAKLQTDLDALGQHCAPIIEWRNRRVGHKDLSTALEYHEDPLPNIGRSCITDSLGRIEALMNRIELHFQHSATMFNRPILRGPAKDLIFWLERGHDAEEQERRRALGGGA